MEAPEPTSASTCGATFNPPPVEPGVLAQMKAKLVFLEQENDKLREALTHEWEKQCE